MYMYISVYLTMYIYNIYIYIYIYIYIHIYLYIYKKEILVKDSMSKPKKWCFYLFCFLDYHMNYEI